MVVMPVLYAPCAARTSRSPVGLEQAEPPERVKAPLGVEIVASRPLVDEPELLDDSNRRPVSRQHPGLDAMEAQHGESVPDDGAGGLGREPATPPAPCQL